MKLITLILVLIKVVCVCLDPAHDVFRPISAYQTASYGYLGHVFIALLVVAAVLGLRLQGSGVGVHLEAGDEQPVGQQIFLVALLFLLASLLLALLLTPVDRGLPHILLAVAAMVGGSAYLLVVSIAFRDWMLAAVAVAMLVMCVVPAIHRPAFGIVENLLIAILLFGLIRFYDYTLKKSVDAVRPEKQKKRARKRKPRITVVK